MPGVREDKKIYVGECIIISREILMQDWRVVAKQEGRVCGICGKPISKKRWLDLRIPSRKICADCEKKPSTARRIARWLAAGILR